MTKEKLRHIVQIGKAQMHINDELMNVIRDDSLDISDKAMLMPMVENGLGNVEKMLRHFNEKYLEPKQITTA